MGGCCNVGLWYDAPTIEILCHMVDVYAMLQFWYLDNAAAMEIQRQRTNRTRRRRSMNRTRSMRRTIRICRMSRMRFHLVLDVNRCILGVISGMPGRDWRSTMPHITCKYHRKLLAQCNCAWIIWDRDG